MNEKKIISADLLKWVALITMFIDHIGAGIIEKCYLNDIDMIKVDILIRSIGRLAFPIYCFLLVEGYKYTRSRKKYLGNLIIFAIISEIPFDYMFKLKLTLNYQNVYFTLLIGFLAIWIGGLVGEKVSKAGLTELLQLLVAVPFAVIAQYIHTDYGAWGVMLIAILFVLRDKPRWILCLAGAAYMLSNSTEFCGIISFAFIFFYNGKRSGKINKYVFYSLYPIHLAIYCGIRYLLTM